MPAYTGGGIASFGSRAAGVCLEGDSSNRTWNCLSVELERVLTPESLSFFNMEVGWAGLKAGRVTAVALVGCMKALIDTQGEDPELPWNQAVKASGRER
jgi:hypothetical protein